MSSINITPIGIINTPYTEPGDVPIQGKFNDEITGSAEIFTQYQAGLKDLGGFSHAYLIYHFDKAPKENLTCQPFLEDEEHGIFSIRAPNRPNKIGISIVKIIKIENNIMTFSEVDILDKTPLIDIKPYVSHFDARDNVKNGWIDKHFKSGNIPVRALKSGNR